VGSWSLIHWIVVGAIVLLLFGGKGKISDIMGDVARGIKSFKKGLAEDDSKPAADSNEPPRAIEHQKATEAAKVGEQQKLG
jgi:sec-independent protein translocase protein TatA